MLDMGFLPALRRLSAALPRARQTLLFSATLSDEVVALSAEFTRAAARVDVSNGHAVPAAVTHQVHPVAADDKRSALAHILSQYGDDQALVFCKTKRGANRVGEYLEGRGVKAGVIHGNKSQAARTRALDQFRAGRLRVLVATDVAARGLDIPQLPLVVNFDVPLVAEDYIHRVGRTGRAGHGGRAVSLAAAADTPLLRQIQRLLTEPFEQVAIPGFDVANTRAAVYRQPQRPGDHERWTRRSTRPGRDRETPHGGGWRHPVPRQSRRAGSAPIGARRPSAG